MTDYIYLLSLFNGIKEWISDVTAKKGKNLYKGKEILNIFEHYCNINASNYYYLSKSLENIELSITPIHKIPQTLPEKAYSSIDPIAFIIAERLSLIFDYIYLPDNTSAFNMTVGFHDRYEGKEIHEIGFRILCLQASVLFKDLSNKCQSVILASGTLSPFQGLEFEFGCKFPNIFEGKHVIDTKKQVYYYLY